MSQQETQNHEYIRPNDGKLVVITISERGGLCSNQENLWADTKLEGKGKNKDINE